MYDRLTFTWEAMYVEVFVLHFEYLASAVLSTRVTCNSCSTRNNAHFDTIKTYTHTHNVPAASTRFKVYTNKQLQDLQHEYKQQTWLTHLLVSALFYYHKDKDGVLYELLRTALKSRNYTFVHCCWRHRYTIWLVESQWPLQNWAGSWKIQREDGFITYSMAFGRRGRRWRRGRSNHQEACLWLRRDAIKAWSSSSLQEAICRRISSSQTEAPKRNPKYGRLLPALSQPKRTAGCSASHVSDVQE